MLNRTTVQILFVAIIVGLGLWATERYYGAGVGRGPALEAVRLLPQHRALPAFALRQSDGTQLVPGELKGHWTLIYLGYTRSPDDGPATLTALAQAQEQWRALPASTRPRLLFVSVDPDRDSTDQIGEYAHSFHRDTLAATADLPTLESLARALSMAFVKVPAPNHLPADRYDVDHSATIAVLDPQVRMAGVISPPLDPQAIARDLMALTAGTSP